MRGQSGVSARPVGVVGLWRAGALVWCLLCGVLVAVASPAGAGTAAYAAAVLADHPVAYWPFADAASSSQYADASGNGGTLTAVGTTLSSPGVGGTDGALVTAATGGAVLPKTFPALTGDASRIVEVWFRTSDQAG